MTLFIIGVVVGGLMVLLGAMLGFGIGETARRNTVTPPTPPKDRALF